MAILLKNCPLLSDITYSHIYNLLLSFSARGKYIHTNTYIHVFTLLT